jgi:ketosteroid isomerase-like protein
MDRQRIAEWVEGYERAWRAPGTDLLASIFTESASYLQSPYAEPVRGLSAIARMWDDHRDGPDEPFQMTSDTVAVDGDTAVVRVEVLYGPPNEQEYRDLWIIRLAEDGRCYAFEEWPFWPAKSPIAPAPED